MALDQRRSALGLKAVKDRRLAVFLEPLPPRGHVARVPDGDGEGGGRLSELVAGLEGRGLLPLDAPGVDRVDQLDGMLLGDLPDDLVCRLLLEKKKKGNERKSQAPSVRSIWCTC